jgi:hypothetical protein
MKISSMVRMVSIVTSVVMVRLTIQGERRVVLLRAQRTESQPLGGLLEAAQFGQGQDHRNKHHG